MPQSNTSPAKTVEWLKSPGLIPYPEAVHFMEQRAADIRARHAPECVWLLEHPPLYTAGISADPAEILEPDRHPVYPTGRGGRYTYHGPGQRVAYVMLDLKRHGRDLKRFVHRLEDWLIAAIARFGVTGERRADRIGIWVVREDGREQKIAALGIRVRHWVSFHGVALNVRPDLEHFSGIVPCGLRGHEVTSMADLGVTAGMDEVDDALAASFEDVFGVPIELVMAK